MSKLVQICISILHYFKIKCFPNLLFFLTWCSTIYSELLFLISFSIIFSYMSDANRYLLIWILNLWTVLVLNMLMYWPNPYLLFEEIEHMHLLELHNPLSWWIQASFVVFRFTSCPLDFMIEIFIAILVVF